GGPDSMVLLDLFLSLKNFQPFQFCVANVDHKIRKESSFEQKWLKGFCENKSIVFYGEEVDIKGIKKSIGSKMSLEELARKERYKILKKLKEDYCAKWVVSAHHKDDLLETFFLRLLRGTGLNGINSLNKVEGYFLRPLLSYFKEEIMCYTREKDLHYFQDHTNEDTQFLRNRIRHNLIPFLKNEFGDEIQQVLVRDIENLKNADRVLTDIVKSDIQKASFSEVSVEINQKVLVYKSLSYQREFLLRLYQNWVGSPVGLTSNKLENICLKLLEKGDFEITITDSIRFLRSNDRIGFSKMNEKFQKLIKQQILLGEDFKKKLESKNVITVGLEFYDHKESVQFQLQSNTKEGVSDKNFDKNVAYLDYDAIQFPLTIRLWKEGDRIKPFGMRCFKRISRLMTDAGIKKYAKRKQLILENGKHDIIWCMGLRISEDYKIIPNTVRCLKIIYNVSKKEDIEGRERDIPQRIVRDEEK
ncbi:MAG: tRNA lysidine(34) synthetase TilS, partial [Thermotogota bacterium]